MLCDSVYSLNNKKCCREKGHAGEHCHTTWDRQYGQRNEWWSDEHSVKKPGDVWMEGNVCIRKIF